MKFQSLYYPFANIPVAKSNKSQTVPDMSFTPREIIQKFSRGERVPLGLNGNYDSDDASAFDEDPTRDPAFDFGDYVEEKHALEERQRIAKEAAKAKQAANSKRKASAEELSASDAMTRETISGESAVAPPGSAKE